MARRPRGLIEEELARIESLVGDHPEGMSLRAILEAFPAGSNSPMSESTMLRRLRLLQDQGRIRSEGLTQAAHYFSRSQPAADKTAPTISSKGTLAGSAGAMLKRPATTGAAGDAGDSDTEGDVPLTAEGEEARALIRQPLHMRQPVGYREAFLRDYRPGETWYLTEEMRERLHELGRTPDADLAAGTFAHEIYERLLIDLSWASSHLEGNTYTLLDTENLLELGVPAEGKEKAEAQMILNHKKAIELLVDNAENVGFDRYTIFNLHAALAENLLKDPRDEGRLRTRIVGIGKTAYIPLSIPQKIEEMFDLMLRKAEEIPDAFEKALFIMVHLPYLQPFIDVNKRTSRLAANIPLIKANLRPLSFIGLPRSAYIDATLAVYEFNRVEILRDGFMLAYERSSARYGVIRESVGEPDPIRLGYRSQLSELVRDFVLREEPPELTSVQEWARTHGIPQTDHNSFAEIALTLLQALHEGSISRYGLRLSEFKAWRGRIEAKT
jgi:hypothetical protein